MNKTRSVLVTLVVVGYLAGGFVAFAEVPAVYTNENFFMSTQDAPKSFWSDGMGGYGGLTTTGKYFTQRPVVADMHVGLQRFSIDEATFYVSNFGIITAPSDTVALSIYLSRAGWEEVV